MKPQTKAALDFAPLLVFFATYMIARKAGGAGADHALDPGLMWATILFMAATLVSIGISYVLERKIHVLPVVSAAIVLVFGGLTLFLDDDRFIKMKPTIIYSLFAGVLLGGLAAKRLFIKHVLGTVFELDEAGWRSLTLRWGIFFAALAVLNEILRRVLSTDGWVTFKVWGFMGLVLVFSVWQAVAIARRQAKSGKGQ
jgi:intracellular septation protein